MHGVGGAWPMKHDWERAANFSAHLDVRLEGNPDQETGLKPCDIMRDLEERRSKNMFTGKTGFYMHKGSEPTLKIRQKNLRSAKKKSNSLMGKMEAVALRSYQRFY